jgi:hypothetical protein
MMIVIDPPSGWMYGFPKLVNEDILCDAKQLRAWLIEQGYPEKDVDFGMRHYRCWEYKEVQR